MKKDKVEINTEELKPTVLGEVTTEKNNLLPLISTFVIFIGIIYFLPDITSLANKLLGKSQDSETPITKETSELKCTKDEEMLVYYFENEKLIKVRDYNKYFKDSTKYEESYESNKKLIEEYSTYKGITAKITDLDDGYDMLIIIDLKKVNQANIKDVKYYNLNKNETILKTDMTSKEFICS